MSDTGNEGGSGEGSGTQGNDNQGENKGSGGENKAIQANDDTGRAGSHENLKADLAAERKGRQAAEREAKEANGRLAKLEEATKSESEKAIDKARKEGESEATKRANRKIAQMALRAAAADVLADPTDADTIDASPFIDDDGNVDDKAVSRALADLVKDKPHWAKAGRGNGSADQGARGKPAKSNDMNSVIRQAAGVR